MLDFSQIMEDELQKYFIKDSKDLKNASIIDISEVELVERSTLADRDSDPNALADIKFIEEEIDSSIFAGIQIPTGQNVLKDNNFGAIDGSSARINRNMVSPILARSAFGSYSHEEKLPMYEIIDMDVNYVVSHENIVKIPYQKKIRKIHNKETREYSLNLVASDLQAELEIRAIPKVIEKWGKDMDYLCLDGPLYYRNKIKSAFNNVEKCLNEGIQIFSIVKRSQDNAFLKKIQFLAQKNKAFKLFSGWCHSDRDFFTINLRKGYRTPFYYQVNTREKLSNIKKNMKRVCSWIKLESGKVCRIEIPSEIAGVDQNLEPAKDIVAMVYKMSVENGGKLPICIERADSRALISMNDVKNYSVVIDKYLKSMNIPTGDPDYWK